MYWDETQRIAIEMTRRNRNRRRRKVRNRVPKNAFSAWVIDSDDTVFTVAGRAGVDVLQDLHAFLATTVAGVDGVALKLHQLRITIEAQSESAVFTGESFAACPVIVACAGNVTDVTDINTNDLHTLIDNACDDEFAMEQMAPFRDAIRETTVAQTNNHYRATINFPPKYLRYLETIVNEETSGIQTVRAVLALINKTTAATTITTHFTVEARYTRRQKTLRMK